MEEEYLNLLALPKDVIGLIFNMLEVVDELRSHRCVAKSWSELYWSTLTGVTISSISLSALEDRHLIYILKRVNPFRLYSLDIMKPGSKLTLASLALLSQLTNLKTLRINDWAPDLIKQTVPNLISLRDLHIRSKNIEEDSMDLIAEHLAKLTRVLCATSTQLYRWRNVSKLTQLKELTIALTPNFSAEGYADLAALEQLTFLNVNASGCSEKGLMRIFRMTSLQTLLFIDAKVRDPHVYAGLANMTKLRKLHGKILTDEQCLAYLAQVYSLTALGVQSGERGEPGNISAKFLSRLTALKEITGVKIDDTTHMMTLTNLESLKTHTQVIDEQFPLQVMTRLSHLLAQNIHSTAMQKISKLVNLDCLSFNDLIDPQEPDFEGIEHCTRLRVLTKTQSSVSNKQFEWIAQCTTLRELRVQASPKCAKNYVKLTQLTALRISHPDWTLQDALKLTVLTLLTTLMFTNQRQNMTKEDESEILNQFSPDVRTHLYVRVTP